MVLLRTASAFFEINSFYLKLMQNRLYLVFCFQSHLLLSQVDFIIHMKFSMIDPAYYFSCMCLAISPIACINIKLNVLK